jgi:capsid protein
MRVAAGSGMPVVPETVNKDFASAQQIAMTTQKQVFNMEPGSKLVPHKNEAPNNFKDFFTTNFEIICGALGIPPEVALNKYNSNYSASRMAVKSWEYKFMVDRESFGLNFYKPIFVFWLDTNVIRGQIIAPDYEDAYRRKDTTMLDAFRNCAFIGPGMPHIDPVKEAKAEEIKLNNLLTTREKSTRDLGGGDWYQNIENRKREEDKIKELGLSVTTDTPTNVNEPGNVNE